MAHRLPPLNALRAFEAAARHLSFTRAAGELHVTQAAVSHQIRGLEDWLGRELFRRRGRQVFLTEAGQAYAPAVREALDSLARATAHLLARNSAGVLQVTMLPSFAAKWLVPRLSEFNQRHRDIEVRISADARLVDLEREDVDLAVRYGSGNWPGLRAVRFMTEDLIPVCSPDLLAGGPPLRKPADLRHHVLLHDHTRDDWRRWCMAAGIGDIDTARGPGFDDSSLLLQAAVEGQGVAVGRSALAAKDLAAGRLVRPFELTLPARFAYYAVTTERGATQPKVTAFVDWLLARASEEAAA